MTCTTRPGPELTVGCAVYDDAEGVVWTVNALRLYHPEAVRRCELAVIDNHPNSPHGNAVKNFLGWVKGDFRAVRYVPYTEATGTSAPRDHLFRVAQAPAVLCLDPHVMLAPGALAGLLDYYRDNPGAKDLLSGPMIYDDLKNYSTHMADVWRGEMWGTWDTDRRADAPDAPPFEIPAMGLGAFSCRKDAWQGFNPRFRGFGGEEWYVHEKFRRAGAKCLCLPFLRWWHRFLRIDSEGKQGPKYPLARQDKVRNYMLGLRELGLPLDRCHKHFVLGDGLEGRTPMPQAEWDRLLAEVDGKAPPPAPVATPNVAVAAPSAAVPKKSCSQGEADESGLTPCEKNRRRIAAQKAKEQATQGEAGQVFEKLRELASRAGQVAEISARPGATTLALLEGKPRQLLSYYLTAEKPDGIKAPDGTIWTAGRYSDPQNLAVGLLVIDGRHTAAFLSEALRLHAPPTTEGRSAERIAVRWTGAYGEHGEDGGPGLLVALRQFLRKNMEWTVTSDTEAAGGLTVISRLKEDKEALPGLTEKAGNALKAGWRAVRQKFAGRPLLVSEEVAARRQELCLLCPHRTGENCARCGCYLIEAPGGIPGKTLVATEACPIGKWHVETEHKEAS